MVASGVDIGHPCFVGQVPRCLVSLDVFLVLLIPLGLVTSIFFCVGSVLCDLAPTTPPTAVRLRVIVPVSARAHGFTKIHCSDPLPAKNVKAWRYWFKVCRVNA